MNKTKYLILLFSLVLYTSSYAQVVRTVTSLFDSGSGTLRDAISLCTSGDTVRINVTGTITLTNGKISFNSGIYIDGPGKDSLIIDAGKKSEVFNITDGNVTIKGVTIRNGDPYGVYYSASSDSLTILECAITKCYTKSSRGAGLYVGNSGYVHLAKTSMDTNTIYGDGVTYVYGAGAYIRASAKAVIDGCTFNKNVAQSINWGGTGSKSESRGGGLYVSSPDLTIKNTDILSNTTAAGGCCGYRPNWARSQGAGLYFSGAKMQMNNCRINSNRVSANDFRSYNLNQGSAIYLDGVDSVEILNSSIRKNSSHGGNYVNLYGGTIYTSLKKRLFISNTAISNNSSSELGGLCVKAVTSKVGEVVLDGVRIDSNYSSAGEYMSAAYFEEIEKLRVGNSTFINNAKAGIMTNNLKYIRVYGSLFDKNKNHMYFDNPSSGYNFIVNSTLRNSSDKAVYFKNTSSNYFYNNTFVNNTGDIYFNNSAALFANNIFTYDKFIASSFSRASTEVPLSGGGNVVKGSSFSTFFTKTNDKNTRDPELDSFGYHGGLIKSYSLKKTSVAIDLGKDTLKQDQRGYLRDSLTDAGSFEFGGTNPYFISLDTIVGTAKYCEGDTFNLEVKTTGTVDEYKWYKDGKLLTSYRGSKIQIDSVTIVDTGSYKCVISNSKFKDSSNLFKISVFAYPNVLVFGADTICTGDTTKLYVSGATTYYWKELGLYTDTVLVHPLAKTTYHVSGTSNGCTSNGEVHIGVDTTPTVVAFGADTICTGESTKLSVSGADKYMWSHSAGTNANITVSPMETTTYKVSGTTKGCMAYDEVTVKVDTTPTVRAIGADTICDGESAKLSASGAITYEWDNNAGTSASVIVSPNATTTYTVKGTTKGCSSSDIVKITVNPIPSVNAYKDSTICEGESVEIYATGATKYSWDNNAGDSSHVIVSPGVNTTYTVTGTSKGCNSSDKLTITVKKAPSVSVVANDSSLCDSGSVILSASGAKSYSWNNSLGTGSSVVAKLNTTTTYAVKGTSNGCSATSEVTIDVFTSPNPPILKTGKKLETGIYASYQWYLDGNKIQDSTNNSIIVKEDGDYTVEVFEDNGCSGTSAIVVVTDFVDLKNFGSQAIKVYPNPNSGLFHIDLSSLNGNSNLRVYNTIGELVYKLDNIDRTKTTIDLANKPVGVYLLSVEMENETHFKRIVIQ